jgi:REP element-mobilizing transposase RayT
MKISYTKVWPRKYGSPFTKGNFYKNLKYFFITRSKKRRGYINWTMPSKLPKLNDKK